MQSWTFYPVFLGAFTSFVCLTHFAVSQRGNLNGRSLSEVATIEQKLLSRFRYILLFCGLMFAITLFGFITPNAHYAVITFIASAAIIVGELFAGVFPAHKNTLKVHEILAGLMGAGMLAFPFVLIFSIEGFYRYGEALLGVLMLIFCGLMFADRSRRRFVSVELSFIFASHISIMLAALALR